MANTVNEKSPLYMTMAFTDENGDPLVPSTVEWKLDDIEQQSEIVPWTSLGGLAAIMNVVIPSANNAIVTETSVREERMFSVRVNDGLLAEAHEQFQYHVLNLYAPSGA